MTINFFWFLIFRTLTSKTQIKKYCLRTLKFYSIQRIFKNDKCFYNVKNFLLYKIPIKIVRYIYNAYKILLQFFCISNGNTNRNFSRTNV